MLAVLAGSVAQWLTAAAILAGAWVIWRGGGGTAVRNLQDANRVLEHEQRKDKAEIAKLRGEVAELRGRTDVSVAIAPLVSWSTQHEERAQERHDGTLKVLALIAERLGPDDAHLG